jgi:hypothetical protein
MVFGWMGAGYGEEGKSGRLGLLPWPKSVEMGGGVVRLGEGTRIVVMDEGLKRLGEILSEELRLVVGRKMGVVMGGGRVGDIVLRLDERLEAGEEILRVKGGAMVRNRAGAYRLEAKGGVVITGYDYRAVAEGTTTLVQAVRRAGGVVEIPEMKIWDWPHADFTGVMLDVARQASSVEEIRRCVVVCRAYKVRYLQLHLTDDQGWAFPSGAYPQLGMKNGSAHGGPAVVRYSLEELKGLVKYADERGVTLVPELETPGHSGSARGAMPEVFGYVDAGTKAVVDQGMMNIANPRIYGALETIIGEMCEVFGSSPYFHLGCDEVSGLGRVAGTPEAVKFMEEKKLKDGGELLGYFVRRMNEMVKARGKKAILWEGAANGVAKDVIYMTWDGGARTAERMIAEGLTTITVPWNLAGVRWEDWNMYKSNGSILKKGDGVLGAMLPVWEQRGEVNLRWLRGGLPKREERTWGPDTVVEAGDFERRVGWTDGVLDRLLYGFAVEHRPRSEEGLMERTLSEPVVVDLAMWGELGRVHFTTDGSEPTAKSGVWGGGMLVRDNLTVKARGFGVDGVGVGATWVQPYGFGPLLLEAEGLDGEGGWFREKAVVRVKSTVGTGRVRYTVDGSVPVGGSRVMDGAVVLTESTTVQARWFDEENVGRGKVVSGRYEKLETMKHAGVGRPVRMVVTAKLEDAEAGAKLLVDGSLGRMGNWGTPEVLRLGESDLEAVIDLGEEREVKRVVVRCYNHQEAGVYPAKRVEVGLSSGGKEYTVGGRGGYVVPKEAGAGGSSVKEIVVEVSGRGRYVKVFCENNGLLPEWHRAPGVKGHLMIDEILIDPVGK